MRKLPTAFMDDLKDEKGILYPLLKRIKQDNTLMLSIRDGYINIYYRGGNLLRVNRKASNTYQTFFDRRYNKSGVVLPVLTETIRDSKDAEEWVAAFPRLKETMDLSFSIHNKPEREFQQLIARENNFSTISNETEYFITDIEFSDSSIGARFDLLAVRWLAAQRKNGAECRPALIELKYGDGALDGNAGLLKHLEDIDTILSDTSRYESILNTIVSQFEQLDELGLIKFKHPKKAYEIKLDTNIKPEVIIVLANHNPRSRRLKDILDKPEMKEYGLSTRFDLKFLMAKFAGYGFHNQYMLSLTEFRKAV